MKYRCLAPLFTFTTAIINDQDSLASEDDLLRDPVAIVEIMIIAIITFRKNILVAKVIIIVAKVIIIVAKVIVIVIPVVITITKYSLASEDALLCNPIAIVEEAIVGQGMLEHVDLSRPFERPCMRKNNDEILYELGMLSYVNLTTFIRGFVKINGYFTA